MKKVVFVLVFAALAAGKFAFGQNQDVQAPELKKIYEGLEYNTIAFEDLKQNWIVNDPIFVREIYNRFVVKDALRIDGKTLTMERIKDKSQEIYDGKLVVELRKRYYDDEIEFFAFVPESEVDKKDPKYAFDPVKDPFMLRDILGERVYFKIRTQSYFFSNLTKEDYDTKAGYYFLVNTNLLQPQVMFWNTTSNFRNKYTLSWVGKWGQDRIALPGWFACEYTGALDLTYYEKVSSNPENYTYSVRLGTTLPASMPYVGGINTEKKRLYVSGQTLYFRASGNLLKYIFPDEEFFNDFQLNIESKYTPTVNPARSFGKKDSTDFYTNKSYFVIEATKKNLYSLGDFGSLHATVGIATMDMWHYLIAPGKTKLIDLESRKDFVDKFSHFLFSEVGITRTGGLIQHDVRVNFNYAVSDGMLWAGVASRSSLSDNFGADIRVMVGLGTIPRAVLPWRTDTYIVFSPFLKINY